MRRRLFIVVAAPALLGAAGYALAWLLRREVLALAFGLRDLLWGVGGAAVAALLVFGLYYGLPKLGAALERSSLPISQGALQELGFPLLLLTVTLSAFGEELLFRGGLQPTLGLWPSALLFGLAHGGWRLAELWSYVLVATLAGALFGYLYLLSGSLVASMLAHGVYNVAVVISLRFGLFGE